MQGSQKSFILFLLLFIQNHQPILSTIEDEFSGASAYIPKSPLVDDYYDETDKKSTHNTPNRPKRSKSFGKYGLKTPEKYMPSPEILAIINNKNKPTQ